MLTRTPHADGRSIYPAQLGLAAKLRLSSLSIRIHSYAPLEAHMAPVTIALIFLGESLYPGNRLFTCPRVPYIEALPPGW
jgi:hypothetical protein